MTTNIYTHESRENSHESFEEIAERANLELNEETPGIL